MSKIGQLSSSVIYTSLSTRLSRTNALNQAAVESKISEGVEWEKTLYTQYYFDFSTAIEAVLRGIVFEVTKKMPALSGYITYLAKHDDTKKPYFLDFDEVSAITGCKFFSDTKANRDAEFKSKFLVMATPLRSKKTYQPLPENRDSFFDLYREVKRTRNTLAHGLLASGVDYNSDRLCQFCALFYYLFKFYENLEKGITL